MNIFVLVLFLSCSMFASEQSDDQFSNFRAAVKQKIDEALEYDPEDRAVVVRNFLAMHKGSWPEWREILMQGMARGIPAPQLDSEYDPNLLHAVMRSDAEIVALLLDHKADPNKSNNLRPPALFYAETPEIAHLLLKHKADVNGNRKNVVNLLFGMVYALVQHLADDSALYRNCVHIAEIYFDHGIDPMACQATGNNVLHMLTLASLVPVKFMSQQVKQNLCHLRKLFIERGVPLYSCSRDIDNVHANLTLVERLRVDVAGPMTSAVINAKVLRELCALWKNRREKLTQALEPHCGRNLTQLVLDYDDMEKFNQTPDDDKRCRALVEQQKKDIEDRSKKLRKQKLDEALLLARAPVTQVTYFA